MNGRSISWTTHALLDHSPLSDHVHLESILRSPAIEVALTKVVEGGVSGYYSQFGKIVSKILDDEPGCDGYFISPLIEQPQDQLLLINWKSVDVSTCVILLARSHYSQCVHNRRPIMRNSRRSLVLLAALTHSVTTTESLLCLGTSPSYARLTSKRFEDFYEIDCNTMKYSIRTPIFARANNQKRR
jgi:hypothetical protein